MLFSIALMFNFDFLLFDRNFNLSLLDWLFLNRLFLYILFFLFNLLDFFLFLDLSVALWGLAFIIIVRSWSRIFWFIIFIISYNKISSLLGLNVVLIDLVRISSLDFFNNTFKLDSFIRVFFKHKIRLIILFLLLFLLLDFFHLQPFSFLSFLFLLLFSLL